MQTKITEKYNIPFSDPGSWKSGEPDVPATGDIGASLVHDGTGDDGVESSQRSGEGV